MVSWGRQLPDPGIGFLFPAGNLPHPVGNGSHLQWKHGRGVPCQRHHSQIDLPVKPIVSHISGHFFLFRMETGIFQHQNIAGFQDFSCSFSGCAQYNHWQMPLFCPAVLPGVPPLVSVRYLASGPPLGRPRWEHRITAAPCSSRYLIVGSAAVNPGIICHYPVFHGNIKIHPTRTFFPFTSISRIVFLLNMFTLSRLINMMRFRKFGNAS